MKHAENYCYDCEQPTSLYLCPTCTSKLQAHLDKLTPDLLARLLLIARGQAKPSHTAARSTTSHGSQAPVNLKLLDDHRTYSTISRDAHNHANNPHMAAAAPTRNNRIEELELIVYGKDQETKARINAFRLSAAGLKDPMTPPQASQAILNATGQLIQVNTIKQWYKRGKLTPAEHRPLKFLPQDIWAQHATTNS